MDISALKTDECKIYENQFIPNIKKNIACI